MKDKMIESWQKRQYTLVNPDDLVAQLSLSMNTMGRNIFLRNLRETLAAVIVVVVFIYYIFQTEDTVLQTIFALIAFWAISVVYILWEKEKRNNLEINTSITSLLSQRRDYYSSQFKLLKRVGIWYVLPPFILVTVYLFYIGGIDQLFSIYYASVIVFLCLVYWMNVRYATKKMLPLIEEIDQLIEHFNSGNEED